MVGLYTWKFIQYKNRVVYKLLGPCVCIAKGAAETLKLNMAIILLPVCRTTITWLRNKTRLGVAVPFDDNLNFHKVSIISIRLFNFCIQYQYIFHLFVFNHYYFFLHISVQRKENHLLFTECKEKCTRTNKGPTGILLNLESLMMFWLLKSYEHYSLNSYCSCDLDWSWVTCNFSFNM